MGGFFGVASKNDAVLDTFFGVDYHSHLGTRRAGMAAVSPEAGMQRKIHKIENSPFRTKFENILDVMEGNTAIGCISDSDAQPLLIRSNHGLYAICTIGIINNSDALVNQYLSFSGGHFGAMTTTGITGINASELVAAMIDQKSDFAEGASVNHAYDRIRPYGFHLDMVVNWVRKYIDEVCVDEHDLL